MLNIWRKFATVSRFRKHCPDQWLARFLDRDCKKRRTVGGALPRGYFDNHFHWWRGPDLIDQGKTCSARKHDVLLRKRLPEEFPEMSLLVQSANIISQIVKFGPPAPFDLQVVGRNAEANYKVAQRLAELLSRNLSPSEVHIHPEPHDSNGHDPGHAPDAAGLEEGGE